VSQEPTVAPGEMRLYDEVRPALPDDTYRLTATSQLGRDDFAVPAAEAYFELAGPRFALPASEVVAVHPPRDAQGEFSEVFPHLVLGRRTLPWERELDPDRVIPATPLDPLEPEPPVLREARTPWLALLVFVDDPTRSEVTVLPQPVPLSTVVTDPAVLARYHLGGTNPAVPAIQADTALLRRMMPTRDEVQVLSHVRQVNVDDRELAAGDSDGWFAVVMANRLPTPGLRHRACLVSLEQRSDLVGVTAPDPGAVPPAGTSRLVLLHSWTFTAAAARPGGGSFKELTQALDPGLLGAGIATGTGHVRLHLRDRAGGDQPVFYRGPLVGQPVERDPLGPYHAADQARRVSAAGEDVTYSAAFEVGRLLAAADGRLAQELMSWRREAYQTAARRTVAAVVWQDLPAITTTSEQGVTGGMVPPVALTMFERAGSGAGESADLTGARLVRAAPGLNAAALAAAWDLAPEQAARLLAQPAPTATEPTATEPAATEPAAVGPAGEETR
jgi:hypothetical protein